jgi:hypothetical protein
VKSPECGLKLSIKTTKAMIFSGKDQHPPLKIKVNGQELEQVQNNSNS